MLNHEEGSLPCVDTFATEVCSKLQASYPRHVAQHSSDSKTANEGDSCQHQRLNSHHLEHSRIS